MAGKKSISKAAKPASPTAVSPMMTVPKVPKVTISELPEIDYDAELEKARGQTDSQKAIKAYHEGEFQTHDPVTGKKRDKSDSISA